MYRYALSLLCSMVCGSCPFSSTASVTTGVDPAELSSEGAYSVPPSRATRSTAGITVDSLWLPLVHPRFVDDVRIDQRLAFFMPYRTEDALCRFPSVSVADGGEQVDV